MDTDNAAQQGTNGKTPTHQEAPTSWNVKYIMQGFDCLLTIRADSGKELLPATLKAIEWILANNGEPTRGPSTGAFQPAGAQTEPPKLADGSPDPAWCAVHSIAMARHEKDGQAWYSHKVGDSYCKGKAPKSN